MLKSQDFVYFLFVLKLSYSKPFWNNLNYASTANIQEVMKVYNLGEESLKTDFSGVGRNEKSPLHILFSNFSRN